MKRILVADDHELNLELTRAILESRGFEVFTASDGIEVLGQLDLIAPDVVLVDIQMPRLDGLTLIKRIRRFDRFANLPCIACSASAMMGDKEVALASGFDAFIEKPFQLETLVDAVNLSLNSRHNQK